MTQRQHRAPDPVRVEMMQASRYWSSLHAMAAAVAAASEKAPIVYVERKGDGYRWSLASQGGPHPLLHTGAK